MKTIYDDVKAKVLKSSYVNFEKLMDALSDERFTGYIEFQDGERIHLFAGKSMEKTDLSDVWTADIYYLNPYSLALLKFFEDAEHKETLILMPKMLNSLIRSEISSSNIVWIDAQSEEGKFDILIFEENVFYYKDGRRIEKPELKEKLRINSYSYNELMEEDMGIFVNLEMPSIFWNAYKDELVKKMGERKVADMLTSVENPIINPLSGLFSINEDLTIKVEAQLTIPEVKEFRKFIFKLLKDNGYEVV